MENLELNRRRAKPIYYQLQYRRTIRWLFFSCALAVLLSLIQAYALFTYPVPATYVTSTEGSLHPIQGMLKPDFSGVIKDVR